MLAVLAAVVTGQVDLPPFEVTADNARIDHSCRVVIAPGAKIADADGNGVIHIVADNVVVEFADGSALVGQEFKDKWDQLTGSGLRVEGRKGITLKNVRVSGYKVGIWATNAEGLRVEGADLCDNFRQRLGSTPWAEDGSDWLWPHDNDSREWATKYGAALLVERSNGVVIHDVRVRRGQNGIMLDRVNDSQVYDNDCSFLSGWGLSMWRSNRNTVSRNAFDFCVRGHSEGVYNRGQDSAGILCFEQCSENKFLLNSCTHGGDGFFGFAGKEAIGEREPVDGPIDLAEAGCNDNEFVGNRFSYASAHGLEMTFSLRNVLHGNSFVENAICGIWGGYSNDSIISTNHFISNGGMAYGLERGAINIEHGSGNLIHMNTLKNNKVGVHLWLDSDEGLRAVPGVRARHRGVSDNRIAWNFVSLDGEQPFGLLDKDHPLIGVQVRRAGDAPGLIQGNTYAGSYYSEFDTEQTQERVCTPGIVLAPEKSGPFDFRERVKHMNPGTQLPDVGRSRPTADRTSLAGRANIIMDEWGPWDHESPMVRLGSRTPTGVVYEVRGAMGNLYAENLLTGEKEYWAVPPAALAPLKLSLVAEDDVTEYAWRFVDGPWSHEVRGTITRLVWDVSFFKSPCDPREDVETWRAGAYAEGAAHAKLTSLDLKFGHKGPAGALAAASPNVVVAPELEKIPANHYGMVASSSVSLPPGRWKFRVESDDGVRLAVDGKAVIDNWTHHGPTIDTAEVSVSEHRSVELELQYFQLDGFAVLRCDIERVPIFPAQDNPAER